MRERDGAADGESRATMIPGRSRMSDELVAALRRRVDERFYDQPQILEIIARAILHSRGLYL